MTATKHIFVLLVAILALLAPAKAAAETVTVGLFAPTAPFPSTSARVELATRLGEHVGKALGTTGSGNISSPAARPPPRSPPRRRNRRPDACPPSRVSRNFTENYDRIREDAPYGE